MASDYDWNEERPPIGAGGGDDADFWRARRAQKRSEGYRGDDRGRPSPEDGGGRGDQRDFGQGARRYGAPQRGGAGSQAWDQYPDVYGAERGRFVDGPRFAPQAWDRPQSVSESRAEQRSFSPYEGGGARFHEPARAGGFGAYEPAIEGEHRGRGPKGYARSEGRILEDVHDVLTEDPHIDATHITAEVSNGEVTLNGHVASRQDKRRSEDIVERISGVKHVQNNLRIHDVNYNPSTALPAGPGHNAERA